MLPLSGGVNAGPAAGLPKERATAVAGPVAPERRRQEGGSEDEDAAVRRGGPGLLGVADGGGGNGRREPGRQKYEAPGRDFFAI